MAMSDPKESTFDSTSQLASYPPAPGSKGKAPCVPRKGIFKRRDEKMPSPDEEKDGEQESAVAVAVGAEDLSKVQKLAPVAFLSLFRFSTRFELLIDFIGLACAAAAGSGMPLMSLLFGRLTQNFVVFTQGVNGGTSDPAAAAALVAAEQMFKHSAATNATYLAYLGLGLFVATFVYMNAWVYTAEVNAKRIRERYLQAILRQDIAYFDDVGAGEVATRIQTDTHLVQQGISEKVPLVVSYISAFFTGFIVAYVRNWRLALAMTSIMPCMALIATLMGKAVAKYKTASLKFAAEGGALSEEVVSTIRTAHAFGTQEVLAGLYDANADEAHVVDYKAAAFHGCGIGAFFFVIYSAYALAFSFGTTLINEGHANAGQVVNVFMAIFYGAFSLVMMGPEMQALAQGRGAAAKLFATIDRVPPIDSASPSGLQPPSVVGDITLSNVSFRYPSRPDMQVVEDLSLSFPAGSTCALVGASGSGKSTIVSLIERFYDPSAGAVRLDGVDVKELNVRWLRAQIGLVSQEPTLFSTSIRGNVAHGLIGSPWEHAREEEKAARVREACVQANADSFIRALPDGYDTKVGERGFLLSGGQKQRIAIARAIVSDPKILLLDEATSALDTQSEGVVQDALDKAAAGRTTIAIAHRLSTIRDADRIFVMGSGRILEQGTHEELLRNADGAYSLLVSAQRLREGAQPADATEGEETQSAKGAEDALGYEPELHLKRTGTSPSVSTDVATTQNQRPSDLNLGPLFLRLGKLNREVWRLYAMGMFSSFRKGINGFAQTDHHERRVQGDRTALYFFVIAIAAMLVMGTANYMNGTAGVILTTKLKKSIFRAILRQDISYFDEAEHNTGSLVSSLAGDPQRVGGLAGATLGLICQTISTVFIGGIIGLVFAWKVGLIGVACSPFLVAVGYIRLRIVVLKDQANRKAHEDSAQVACEAAGAIRTVASLTREGDCTQLYSQSLEAPLRQTKRTALRSNLLYALSQALSYFVIALVFWYGSTLIASREFSTTDFFVALMATTFASIQAGNVFSHVTDISAAKSAGSAIMRLLDSTPEIDTGSNEGRTPADVRGQIRFENVHFRYPTRLGVPVLRGLSLTIEPGTYVALVGASGCGKSTAIQLAERFYDPQSGHIYLDGEDIADLNIQEYRKNLALVSQEPTLYSGTVRFNILLGAAKPEKEVSQAEIEEACRKANILDFISSLPDGFDTQVGGKGSQLSGGQKQRIAIARALLRNPKVLLLDEATSALDSNSETVVQQALDQASKGRTTIAIAHRLSTIQNADRIYFVQDGSVLESGTHDQLIQSKGAYYHYVKLQTLAL